MPSRADMKLCRKIHQRTHARSGQNQAWSLQILRGGKSMAKFDHLSRLLEQFVKIGPPGCGCAVAKDGKVLYEGYFGYADIEEKRPVAEDTVFRLFSMTRVINC